MGWFTSARMIGALLPVLLASTCLGSCYKNWVLNSAAGADRRMVHYCFLQDGVTGPDVVTKEDRPALLQGDDNFKFSKLTSSTGECISCVCRSQGLRCCTCTGTTVEANSNSQRRPLNKYMDRQPTPYNDDMDRQPTPYNDDMDRENDKTNVRSKYQLRTSNAMSGRGEIYPYMKFGKRFMRFGKRSGPYNDDMDYQGGPYNDDMDYQGGSYNEDMDHQRGSYKKDMDHQRGSYNKDMDRQRGRNNDDMDRQQDKTNIGKYHKWIIAEVMSGRGKRFLRIGKRG